MYKILIIVVFVIGVAVLLYPRVAQWFSARNQELAIKSYFDEIAGESDEDIKGRIENAGIYNRGLAGDIYKNDSRHDKDYESYSSALAVGSDNIICVVEIPKINVRLPVYSGTAHEDLEKGAGHIEGTSLPVGGKGTHCCISAHRGLPNARMFRDLDQVEIGDEFSIYTLNEKLTYTVDDIRVVEPDDVSSLVIDENRDYVTLVTCTPYIINSHRLLVRGEINSQEF